MIFRRIVLQDFNLFYGRQQLDLEGGLYVIHGENGRGKTTLLNAVRWALFGRYYDRQGNVVVPAVILNRDAEQEGKQEFLVELLIDDDGMEILLRRSCSLQAGHPVVQLYVERDGETLDERSAVRLVQNLMDEDVSRFFLFDGEQLREYEELLFEHEDSAQTVQRSIEQILGVPALTNALSDLDAVKETFGRQVTRAARRNKSTEQAALRAEQFEQELATARDNLDALETQKADAEAEVGEANETLQRFEAARDLLREIEALESEIGQLETGQDRQAERLAKALAESWKDVLAHAVSEQQEAIDAALASQRDNDLRRADLEQLRVTLEQGRCTRCGQDVGAGTQESIETVVADLEGSHSNDAGSEDLRASALALGSISRVGRLDEALGLDADLRQGKFDLATKRQELQDLQKRAEAVPGAEISAAARKRDLAQRQLGSVEQRMGEANERIEELNKTLREIREEIRNAEGSEEVTITQARHGLAEDLHAIFDAAKDEFRDALRGKVERDASEIFMALTTEPDFTGLQINANYGLETLGPSGEPVPGRSAGQEQIVALALIGALNRSATKRAPVMMDTPLGRLDATHSAKVLAFLPNMAEQVFLLVHSKEVSDQELAAIRGSVRAEFDLHREAIYRTEIRDWAI